jgi:hypothetical protein
MTTGMSRPPLPLHVGNARPAFHEDPAIDRLIAMNLALTREVSVLKDRLTTLEKLGEQAGWLAADAIDTYTPAQPEREQREQAREALVARVLAILSQEIDELETSATPSAYWQDVEAIEKGQA